jgi:small-conductance mechanosensitive channel
VLSADYKTYMDIQQDINLRIHDQFAGEGIEFVFPTQTLYMVKAETG